MSKFQPASTAQTERNSSQKTLPLLGSGIFVVFYVKATTEIYSQGRLMVHKIEEEIRCKETQRFNMLISELPHSHIMLVNTTFTITIFQETMFTLREMFLCSLTINVLQPYCLTRPTDRSGSTISENFCLLHVPSSENPKHHYIMFHYICALFSKHIQTSIIPVPLTALNMWIPFPTAEQDHHQ